MFTIFFKTIEVYRLSFKFYEFFKVAKRKRKSTISLTIINWVCISENTVTEKINI
jgi:hypothetical protein